MLDKYDFIEAVNRYATTIRAMAEKHGAPEKYHATITFAFMSLMAERRAQQHTGDVVEFLSLNPDSLRRAILQSRYSTERLNASLARQGLCHPC